MTTDPTPVEAKVLPEPGAAASEEEFLGHPSLLPSPSGMAMLSAWTPGGFGIPQSLPLAPSATT
jgi:hypothetical protein